MGRVLGSSSAWLLAHSIGGPARNQDISVPKDKYSQSSLLTPKGAIEEWADVWVVAVPGSQAGRRGLR